jgi:hypothetical protein
MHLRCIFGPIPYQHEIIFYDLVGRVAIALTS